MSYQLPLVSIIFSKDERQPNSGVPEDEVDDDEEPLVVECDSSFIKLLSEQHPMIVKRRNLNFSMHGYRKWKAKQIRDFFRNRELSLKVSSNLC